MDRVLIIYSNQSELDYFQTHFKDRCQVLSASNLSEALQHIKNQKISLVLTAIRLVQLSGPQCASEIRKLNKAIPIVFFSQYSNDHRIVSASSLKEELPDASVTTPCNSVDLVSLIENLLGHTLSNGPSQVA
jgi:DNA-binding NtrC family response regulator